MEKIQEYYNLFMNTIDYIPNELKVLAGGLIIFYVAYTVWKVVVG